MESYNFNRLRSQELFFKITENAFHVIFICTGQLLRTRQPLNACSWPLDSIENSEVGRVFPYYNTKTLNKSIQNYACKQKHPLDFINWLCGNGANFKHAFCIRMFVLVIALYILDYKCCFCFV